VDAFPRIAPSMITRINTAADLLVGPLTYDVQWVQVSQAGGVTEARPIVGGWTDNSPDTQRRRSVLATTRNTWVRT
jgi:hypothetical protein